VSNEQNKRLARRFFEAIDAGDPRELRTLLRDDVVWVVPRSAPAPYGGRHQGADRIVELMLGAVEGTFVPGTQAYEIRVMVAEDDHVLAETQLSARTPDGREYRNFYCFVFEMNDGRIAEIREHVDTIYAASFFSGT
jgi:ketosteroid isomerase-like protein